MHSLAARVRDFLKDLNPSFGEMAVGADLVGEARAEAAHNLSGLCLDRHAIGLACPHLFEFSSQGRIDAWGRQGRVLAASVKR